MRVNDAAEEWEVARLADGNGIGKEAGRQNEGERQTAQIPSPLFRQPSVCPRGTHYDQEIGDPGGDSDNLIDVLELTGADPGEHPMEPAAEERVHKDINVVPKPRRRYADEVAPATAA